MFTELKILAPDSLSYFHFSGNGGRFRSLKRIIRVKRDKFIFWWLEIIFGGNKLQLVILSHVVLAQVITLRELRVFGNFYVI